jgi:ubiquinone/menaquinone biosynthesis C-methylase UbiE
MSKSDTDRYWNRRALTVDDDAGVNMHDTVQRDLELDFVLSHLPVAGRVLEVGCGNGYVTRQLRERARFVDAFDFAENMIARARAVYGETNNRFFHGNVVEAATCAANTYDAVVCVRVLINLRDGDQQAVALDNLARWVKPGGKLILVEGFSEGFAALDRLRRDCGMPPLVPAPINYYAPVAVLWPVIDRTFELVDEFHSGMYDFLTRVVCPRVVGPDRLEQSEEFRHQIEIVARRFNPPEMKRLARVRGFALVKRTR